MLLSNLGKQASPQMRNGSDSEMVNIELYQAKETDLCLPPILARHWHRTTA